MKRFILKICLIGSLVILFYVWQLAIVPPRRGCVFHMLNVKDSLMDNTPSPRLVVLGGSSVAYGICSPMLRDSLNMNVINAGLTAGLGLKYILEEATPHLRQGDVVLICLEYSHLYSVMYGNSIGLGPAMYWTGFRDFNTLNWTQREYALQGLITAVRMNLSTKSQTYATDVFNEYGDVVKRPNASPFRRNEQFDLPLNHEYAECFISCIEAMEKKGCRVLITPQVICRQSFSKDTGEDVAQWLAQNGYPFIASPEEHCMPDSLGLDTDNHMTEEGSYIFTRKVIRELTAHDVGYVQ